MATIYTDTHESLDRLLAMAKEDANLLIPDLQRPYVWTPDQVIRLVDSLIRGWPFGTLLTWKVRSNDEARELARSFWKVVDRTGEDDCERVSKKHPPATFHMVLDGQQRVQSLLLALGGDGWGFKLLDRQWHEILNSAKSQGARGQNHWSQGCLCVDLPALAEAYAQVKRATGIDYTSVLKWVVTDDSSGVSKLPKRPNYIEPLLRSSAHAGRFVRLARLWEAAPDQPGVDSYEAEDLASNLLESYGFPENACSRMARPTGALLLALKEVKQTRVMFLELTEYGPSLGSRESYNDAVVNIFTRLNTAGRTLTREDITFAWLKVGWKVALTMNRNATQCFEQLAEDLESLWLPLSNEDLVSAISFLWSVNFNDGKLLTNNDLLKGEAIRPMAEQMSQFWGLVTEALIRVSERVKDRRLKYGQHYQSLNALSFLWAMCFGTLRSSANLNLKESEKDELDKRLVEVLDKFADRWLICSQWAGRWAVASAETISGYAMRLSSCLAGLEGKKNMVGLMSHLTEYLESEVIALERDAIGTIGLMNAIDRKQVRNYYTALWVWNRLEKKRWEMAQVTLREKTKKLPSLDVDHVVAWDLWQKKLPDMASANQDERIETSSSTRDELAQAVNQLGNCLLLEKNFNISKNNKPLKEFLNTVYEFKDGKLPLEEWADALNLEMPQVDSKNSSVDELVKLFSERTAKIRGDLEDFVRGKKPRIDLQGS